MPDPNPPRPVDARVAAWFPELPPSAREATRLHPRRARPGVHDSSIGGPALWPSWDEWPECPWSSHGFHAGTEYPIDDTVLMVPVLQLYRRDAPWVDFPEDADLLQVLWCPGKHASFNRPEPLVVWWDSASFDEALEVRSERHRGRHVPEPCAITPERVLDLPAWTELDGEIGARREAFEAATGVGYEELASPAGAKIGGYPAWWNDPAPMFCDECDLEMTLLLQIGDDEATGLSFGGGFYIFECRHCPDRPHRVFADA